MIRSRTIALGLALALGAGGARAEEAQGLLLATTTSVRDAGLLDALLPEFTQASGLTVRVVAVGSGAALQLAKDGNADLVLAHAHAAEEKLVAEGVLIARRALAENYFEIVGPPEDPAGVRGARDAAEALRRIAAAKAPWVSRGDDSGTHQRERALFESAGLAQDARWPGFASTGAGMGQTLLVAGERRAYALTDGASFRAFRERSGLVRLSGEDPALRNVYSVSLVNPARFTPGQIRTPQARQLADFLLEARTQQRIARFGAEGGAPPLFRPLALPELTGAAAP